MKIPLRGAVACLLKFQYSLLFLSTMTSRVADIWKVERGKEIAGEDVFKLDRIDRRLLLGKQRNEYLLKNHSGACKSQYGVVFFV